MFVVLVEIVVKKEFSERFRDAIIQQGKNSLEAEEGCMRFDIMQDPGDPCRLTLFEGYVDEAAFTVDHRNTPHFARYAESTAAWVESKNARVLTRIWPES